MNIEFLKKYKKHILISITIVIIAIVALKGCSIKGTCDTCGQYENLTKYTYSGGYTLNLCDDCYRYEKLLNSW